MTDDATRMMLDAVGPLWSRERTRKALRLDDPTLARAVADGTVLGVQTDDEQWFFPLSQFEPLGDNAAQVRPGLLGYLEATADQDRWSVAMMLNSPTEELDGLSPIDWLRAGRPDDKVTDYGQILAGEWR